MSLVHEAECLRLGGKLALTAAEVVFGEPEVRGVTLAGMAHFVAASKVFSVKKLAHIVQHKIGLVVLRLIRQPNVKAAKFGGCAIGRQASTHDVLYLTTPFRIHRRSSSVDPDHDRHCLFWVFSGVSFSQRIRCYSYPISSASAGNNLKRPDCLPLC